MQAHTIPAHESHRVVAGLPFVEALARRLAASMPHSIDIGDLVQDGVMGLIDAAHRFDEGRGIKFETFAERRVRGAMIDALRREAWPRGVRRAAPRARGRARDAAPRAGPRAVAGGPGRARSAPTRSASAAPSSASTRSNPRRRCRRGDHVDEASLPAALVPSEPESPDSAYERSEVKERIRAAMATLPARERRLVSLYYFGDVTMKEIGAELGVNESRVSQLHARAIQRLRAALEPASAAARATGAGDAAAGPHRAHAARAARGAARAAVRAARCRRRPTLPRDAAPAAAAATRAALPEDLARRPQQVGQPERLGEPAAAGLLEEALGFGADDVAGDEDDAARQRRAWPRRWRGRTPSRRRAASSGRRRSDRRSWRPRGPGPPRRRPRDPRRSPRRRARRRRPAPAPVRPPRAAPTRRAAGPSRSPPAAAAARARRSRRRSAAPRRTRRRRARSPATQSRSARRAPGRSRRRRSGRGPCPCRPPWS